MNRQDLNKMLFFVSGLDIAKNPEPAAIFDPLVQGFNVWCIPSDHPGGVWESVAEKMDAGTYAKRCEYVGCAFVVWNEGVTGVDYIEISSDAYALEDHHPDLYNARGRGGRQSIHNRPDDLNWIRSKVVWVFEQIGIPCPIIRVGHDK